MEGDQKLKTKLIESGLRLKDFKEPQRKLETSAALYRKENLKNFIEERVKRTDYLSVYVPGILNYSDNFYSYDFIQGKVLSDKVTGKKFEYLLSWLDSFWLKSYLNKKESKEFTKSCIEFYKDKTIQYKKYNS